MQPDIIPLIVILLIFVSSILAAYLKLSVAIIEIILGAAAGILGLRPEEWMIFLATYGGILLTFLAGTEIDTTLLKKNFKVCFIIGFFSFIIPFIGCFSFAYFFLHWNTASSLITGIALSETSLAVVYSVLIEMGLSNTYIGNILMATTFVTNMFVALSLSIIFIKPTLFTLIFFIIAVLVIFLAYKYSDKLFKNKIIKNKVIEPEIKYIFLLLMIFIYFAKLGDSHAILPAFLLGLFMSGHFSRTKDERVVMVRLRTVAYAFITPLFFIVGGLRISLPMIISSFSLFAIFFLIKIITKFAGVYYFAKKYIPSGNMYVTLLMSTGLTFGTIASIFGLQSGLIDQAQYSILIGVMVTSAIIPTFIAQRWFAPKEEEDMLDIPQPEN
ncbi:MAG: cation:proton antiporter [Candidatus Margulisbacteria bacterium]|nr:cation:proton antiporter [Candidatus Margulisiibacteriota bacterium]